VSNLRITFEEIKRVLKPGGHLVFWEHVAAAGTSRRRWQNRINTIWRAVGGCHLDRETEEAIIAAGFKMRKITRESNGKGLSKVIPTIRGIAEKA
jgi:predicted methyltransferase